MKDIEPYKLEYHEDILFNSLKKLLGTSIQIGEAGIDLLFSTIIKEDSIEC